VRLCQDLVSHLHRVLASGHLHLDLVTLPPTEAVWDHLRQDMVTLLDLPPTLVTTPDVMLVW